MKYHRTSKQDSEFVQVFSANFQYFDTIFDDMDRKFVSIEY